MSFTETSETYSPTKKTASIYLTSPSKRKRVEFEPYGGHEAERSNHTLKQIYSWTFRSEAVVSCSVNHALTMRVEEANNYDFYWLGSVPCRSVKIVGIVVGVEVSKDNKKVLYTLDDGTGVIDCSHTPKVIPPTATTVSKYKAPVEPPKQLKPLLRIGAIARCVGRVRPLHDSRQIVVDEITPCSFNDELLHTKSVRHLYKTVYSRKEPFVIPEPPPATPKKPPPSRKFETPSSTSASPSLASSPVKPLPAIASSPMSSPVKSSVQSDSGSSPLKPLTNSPVKLRHPSRLHTHDLTDNTFRIYVKHYMSHAALTEEEEEDDSTGEYDTDDTGDDVNVTPTKRRRRVVLDETPRQAASYSGHGFATPRPRIEPIDFGNAVRLGASESSASTSTSLGHSSSRNQKVKGKEATSTSTLEPQLKGFTLSYLRRVPELSLLATRVVEAVARRHYREERKRLKELKQRGVSASSSSSSKPSTTYSLLSNGTLPPAKLAEKKKRLFKWAVIELMKEGGIALWDGPAWRCPTGFGGKVGDVSRLWKTANSTTISTVGSESGIFGNTTIMPNMSNISNLSGIPPDQDPDESAYLSDPPTTHTEESYIPLTPPYLASAVENAISVLVAHYTSIGRPYAGATKEGILSVLRKDDRWRFVGDWSVEETLESLREEGRVYRMGEGVGRWDLTG